MCGTVTLQLSTIQISLGNAPVAPPIPSDLFSSYSSRHGQIDLNEILDKMNEDPPNLEIGPPKDPKLLKSKILHVRNFWEILENRNFSEDPGLESGTFSL